MLTDRIKYAMDHLSRKQHISLLARPNWRRIQRRNVHAWADAFTTRRAALKARASRRIKAMARPKHVVKKYDATKEPPLYTRIHPKTLAAKISKRVSDLALPKKRLLLANMKLHPSGNMAETLWKVQNSRYRRYRFFCNARLQREKKKKLKIMAKLRRAIKPDEWDYHMDVLEKLAAPKVPPRPRLPGRRKKWRPVNMRRIEDLATPVARELPEARDPFMVPETALKYRASKRIRKIAYPKTLPEIPSPRILGKVSPAALQAIASPRLIVLAKPIERPAGMETDLREGAFTVSPQALKAKCSKRLKLLARPKTRR
ncbi:testicular haploid expressed gene [Xylocopa sonorina]|uniref:testicular haploid expressed gene n=1 Tax=Xylocopa sonorina TaxID=1818115 RepID=UPI00403B01E1